MSANERAMMGVRRSLVAASAAGRPACSSLRSEANAETLEVPAKKRTSGVKARPSISVVLSRSQWSEGEGVSLSHGRSER